MTSRFLAILLLLNLCTGFTLGMVSPTLRGWNASIVKVHYDVRDCGISEAEFLATLESALDEWNSVPSSSLKLEVGDPVTAPPEELLGSQSYDGLVPVVTCATDFDGVLGADLADVVAGVGVFGVNAAQEIVYGFLILNAQPNGDAKVSNFTVGQRQVLVAHELGHVLGLGHSGENAALMYYSIGTKQELRLHQDDMDGITYLYPADDFSGPNGPMGCASP